jgi:NAD+ kinase
VTLRVALIHNQQNLSKEVSKKLLALLQENHIKIDEVNPEIVITVGGDGTLLSAFHRFNHKLDSVSFLGVHTGHLGFYTDWRDYELEELVASLASNRGKSVSYPLLDVRIEFADGLKKHFLALNESTIRRGSSTIVADVSISDEFFERFRGDGLSISTPTGSTAYNKSIGGAVLHPSISAIQLTEIASLNNRVFRTLGSPVVISDQEWLKIELDVASKYMITVDQLDFEQKDITAIHYRVAKERIHFASYRHMHFWHRVREAFISEDEN